MEEKLFIESFSKKGWGVAYLEKTKVEIPHALEGDLVLAKVSRKRKSKRKGRLLQVVNPSPKRVEPKCSHTKICGGCLWQEYAYPSQLEEKEKWIQKNFQAMILQGAELFPVVPCEDPWHYRNKMEFSFSQNGAKTKFLGLMIAGANQYVFNIETCFLAPLWFSTVLQKTRSWWESSSLLAFHAIKQEGHLMNLTLREGRNTQEKMVLLTTLYTEDPVVEKEVSSFVEKIQALFTKEEDLSILWLQKKQEKGIPTQTLSKKMVGKGYIFETFFLLGKKISMKVSPTSFCQPNTLQAQKLYEKAFSLLNLQKDEVVYDLYSGSGSLAMIASFFAKKVYAIEQNPSSVEDALENIHYNQIENVEIIGGDVKESLTKIQERPDAIIVDPPRAGLSREALLQIIALKPKKMVYISCNPDTQLEDVQELIQHGYKVASIAPFDQFPHTFHLENVLLLQRKSG